METLAIMLGAFLFAGYVQTHEVGTPRTPVADSERVRTFIKQPSEFEDLVSSGSVHCPIEVVNTNGGNVWTTNRE